MYTPRLLDHFEHPRFAGELTTADARVRIENPACGDILELAARVEDETIREVGFRAKGCVPAMACGSALATLLHGQSVERLVKLRREDLLREVEAVPPASGHAIHLALDAAAELWKSLKKAKASQSAK
jgi:nitrogen fixation NifU-like protein